ncbi:MAG: hypothetical protein DRQ51_04810 [Gammaproteobacteria bacterium]|nr:MAG: hypothetical protein DRQ51_04810 [Gammaproteobacteria bacterium]
MSNISIESNPVSAGISLGAFKYIDLLKGIYVNPYISSYAGASYNRSDSGKNIWQDSSIMQVGMNIEKRFNIKTGLFYVAPFTGFKYRSMEASADNSNQTWHMTSTSLPLGANIGFSLSKTIGMFFQIATDIFYFSQYKEVGNAKAGAATNTSSGFSYLIGVSTKF